MVVSSPGMVDVASTLEHEMKPLPGPSHRNNKEKATRRNLSIYDPAAGLHVTFADGTLPAGPGTPRHHHNFDQVRYMMAGTTQYDRKRVSKGDLQYVPESTDYGPQTRDDTPRMLVFQFPGQSLIPFFEHNSGFSGTKELMDKGVKFVDGLAVFPDGRKQDGYEAVWEHLAGRKVEYAPKRYGEPIYFHTEAYEWEPTDVRGVSAKHFGRFGAYGPNFGFLRLEPGAVTPSRPVGWMQFRVVIDGEVECGGQVCPEGSRIYEGPGADSLPISSKAGATLMVLQLGYRGKTDPAPIELM